MENAVLYAVENNIATITLNRPSSLNSMNDALIDGIHEASSNPFFRMGQFFTKSRLNAR